MNVKTALSLAAATCLLFQTSTLACADSRTTTNTGPGIRIDVEHLDLRKPEIVAELYAQIQKSASLVCRDSSAPWDAAKAATWKRCVSGAVDGAIRRANAPALTALHHFYQQRDDLAGLTR